MSGPTYNNRRARFGGGAVTASKKKSHIDRAREARRVCSGFPIETGFTRPEDVWEYLNSDKITCLRCGKPYKALGMHLRVHGWTSDRYREFYGLPWRTGLTSSGTKVKFRELGLRNLEAGIAFGGEPGRNQYMSINAPRRKRAPYLREVAVRNILKVGSVGRVWGPEDYELILERMRGQDLTTKEACEAQDVPGVGALFDYRKRAPDFDARFSEVVENLTFATQARCSCLGDRFDKEVASRLRAGDSYTRVARALGVTNMTVYHHRPQGFKSKYTFPLRADLHGDDDG